MSIVSLTSLDDPFFAFDHEMAHRLFLSTHIHDPMVDDPNVPASKWHLDHQVAHDAANLPLHQNLIDSALNNEHQRIWWTFANHQEHFLSMFLLG